MFFFDKPYRHKRFDGYSLLDPQLNMNTMPEKYMMQYYSQIYKKIIEILDVAYSGYTIGEYYFMPVEDPLVDRFNRIKEIILEFDMRLEFEAPKVTLINGFLLNDNFVFYIKLWSSLRDDYFEDVETLSNKYPLRYLEPPDLKLIFNEIDELLEEHKVAKARLLKFQKTPTSNDLLIFGAEKSITKTVFNMLLKANGDWVKVKDMAKKVDRNAAYVGSYAIILEKY